MHSKCAFVKEVKNEVLRESCLHVKYVPGNISNDGRKVALNMFYAKSAFPEDLIFHHKGGTKQFYRCGGTEQHHSFIGINSIDHNTTMWPVPLQLACNVHHVGLDFQGSADYR